MNLKIGVIGVPGGWSTERLAGAVRETGAQAEILDLRECSMQLPDRRLFHRGRAVEGLAAVAVKKIGDTAEGSIVQERINLLRLLESGGIPVFSRPDRIAMAVNRYQMTVELVRAGLPVPETVITESTTDVERAVERFGVAVLKPLFTSKGRGMVLLDASHDVRASLERSQLEGAGPHYLQRFIKHPGRDLGVAVLDGQVLGAYWRVAKDEQWMTTIHAGGRYERADPPPAALELALRAAEHFGLLFTGVDLVETEDNGFVVLEVSAFGGFRGLLTANGVEAAPMIAKAVLDRLARTSR